MAGQGFDEFAEELNDLADRFERAIERKTASSDELVRARDASGEFISFRDAIVIGITEAMDEHVIPTAERDAREWLPTSSDRGRSSDPQIGQDAVGWHGDEYVHRFFSRNDLVAYHEFGTGQHSPRGTTEATGSAGPGYIIRPDEEDVLSFYWDKIGTTVAFEYVVHPGVEGKHFMERALNRGTRTMQRKIADQIDNMDWDEL